MKSKEVFNQIALITPPPNAFVFDPDDTILKSAVHVCCDFPITHVVDFVTGNTEELEMNLPARKCGNVQDDTVDCELLDLDLKGLDARIFQRAPCFSENVIPFVNANVALGKILAWTVDTVSNVAFATKWAGGRARPHEVVYHVSQFGKFSFGTNYPVPDDIVKAIQEMKLKNNFDFTAYKSAGSPGHPSHPAMHSAGSAISSWAQVILAPENLTEERKEMAFRYDWSVATFRSFGGVHYMSDNRAGLQLGRFILGENGPYFLGQTYGCNDETVAAITEYAKSKGPPVNWGPYFPHRWTNPILLSNKYGYTDLDVMAFVNDEGN